MSSPPLEAPQQPRLRSGAALTQLPDSPELKAAAVSLQQSIFPEFSLDSAIVGNNGVVGASGGPLAASSVPLIRRLRSVARYQAFHPRALACSNALTTTYYDDESSGGNNSHVQSTTMTANIAKNPTINASATTTATHASKDSAPSSLGAVAGPQGVALFRLSRPHVPLLILSHATNATASGLSISSLAFQPCKTSTDSKLNSSPRSIFLAAARGSGILVWDASGHTPSPLMGRISVDTSTSQLTTGVDLDTRITSIAWKPSIMAPLLAATTATTLSLWDLRSAPSGSNGTSSAANNFFKPTLRFGSTRNSAYLTPFSSLVQVACSSHSDECATIDASGVVRVYDIRMAERNRSSTGALSVFSAFDSAGVGISHFGNRTRKSSADGNTISTSTTWLTWGMDSMSSSAVIKIWSSTQQHRKGDEAISDDDYWYIDGSSTGERSQRKSPIPEPPGDYYLVGQCVRPNLACARVCAGPVEDSFMAVGHVPRAPTRETSDGGGGWWAELYTLDRDSEDKDKQRDCLGHNEPTFGLRKLVGFQGGSVETDRSLLSALGSRADYGQLQAAELAFSGTYMASSSALTAASMRQRIGDDGSPELYEEDKQEVDLLLCCLSDTGIVTTHVVPEALSKAPSRRLSDAQNRMEVSPSRQMFRTAFSAGAQARVYPAEEKEGVSLVDAAGFWGIGGGGAAGSGGEVATSRSNGTGVGTVGDDAKASTEAPSTPPKAQISDGNDTLMPLNRRGGEGIAMPFDMDVPVAYGSVTAGIISGVQIGVADMSSGNVVTTAGMGALEEGDQVAVDTRDATSLMENIETERVPCPRLCGATFGSGNGGLAIFHNGDVKKMWSWYKRADTVRGIAGPKGDAAFSDAEGLQVMPNNSVARGSPSISSSQVEGSLSQTQAMSRLGPKTLKELINMTATAKKAQWGERNGSAGSNSDDSLSAVDDFFEDDSLGESNSSESGDEGTSTPPPGGGGGMYDTYFGGDAWKNAVGDKIGFSGSPTRRQTSESELSNISKIRPFGGASLDMLAPVVRVTHSYDALVLNNQSSRLAMEWELGDWNLNPVEGSFDAESYPNRTAEAKDELKEEYEERSFHAQLTPPRLGSIHRRHLIPPSRVQQPTLPRIMSDPNMNKGARHQTPKSMNFRQDEPGVHGGEYSVRPNMEESMTFLRKLFTHQQGGGAFPTLLSPPDSPQLSKGLSSSNKRAASTGRLLSFAPASSLETDHALMGALQSGGTQVVKLGVYTVSPGDYGDSAEMEELENIKRICMHNASASESLGEVEKEGVWNLLAQTVDSQIQQRDNTLNGWEGSAGGALGVELVSNLFRFYESLGDVQMLATMFCVLSGASYHTRLQGRPCLLPQGRDEQYDAYIRRYAELLYGWGLLSVLAELNKHLLRIPPRREGEFSLEKMEAGRTPGIAVVFLCPRCGREADANTNICRTCQDYAFRCSICDMAVRGLFTICDLCGHGGHVEHMKSWFSEHVECPTGCGCNCAYSISSPCPPASEGVGA